jgi:hypothetical protein
MSLVVLLAACSRRPDLTDRPLETLSGAMASPLSECPTSKCLTVVVAPWCGVCHAITPHILALRPYLAAKGVATRVVVGHAALETLKPFAAPYGPDTQLDPDSASVPAKDGVPMFVVTDYEGRRLKRVVGFPSGSPTPESLASAFALP